MVGGKPQNVGEKVVYFALQRTFGLIEKKRDEHWEGELTLPGEGGRFGTMLLNKFGFVWALKKRGQCGKSGAAKVLREVITRPWIWLLRCCNYMII